MELSPIQLKKKVSEKKGLAGRVVFLNVSFNFVRTAFVAWVTGKPLEIISLNVDASTHKLQL